MRTLGSTLLLAIGVALGAVSCRSEAPPEGSAPPASASAKGVSARVRILEAPAEGAVEPLVRDAMAAAKASPEGSSGAFLVYVGATWCEPCRRFHDAAERGELDTTFPGMILLEFDLDRDRERLASARYTSKYIPLFAIPTRDGAASGKQVEGGIKGDGAVGFIVPRLKALLAAGS